MIKLPYFKQDTEFSCGPTVMQMVFRFYGKVFSEETLTKRLKTSEKTGTGHKHMIDLARAEGFYVYVNNESSTEEIKLFLDKNIPVIVHFIEPDSDDGHYSVVVGFNDNNIILDDPWNGEGFGMNIKDFEKRWFSEDGKNKKWIMVVSDSDTHIGKQYSPDK